MSFKTRITKADKVITTFNCEASRLARFICHRQLQKRLIIRHIRLPNPGKVNCNLKPKKLTHGLKRIALLLEKLIRTLQFKSHVIERH